MAFVAGFGLPWILNGNLFSIDDVGATDVPLDLHGVNAITISFTSKKRRSRHSWVDSIRDWLFVVDLSVSGELADDGFIFSVGVEPEH